MKIFEKHWKVPKIIACVGLFKDHAHTTNEFLVVHRVVVSDYTIVCVNFTYSDIATSYDSVNNQKIAIDVFRCFSMFAIYLRYFLIFCQCFLFLIIQPSIHIFPLIRTLTPFLIVNSFYYNVYANEMFCCYSIDNLNLNTYICELNQFLLVLVHFLLVVVYDLNFCGYGCV